MQVLKFFLLIILFWLQFSLWFGRNGIVDYIKIYKEIKLQKDKNVFYKIRNQKLELEIEDLYRKNKILKNKI